ncbi:MAG: hypothetical protein Q4Q03_00510 [Bowdeniella nasicola]|nr:hypothetical protein [Bowdeniella nasicola]
MSVTLPSARGQGYLLGEDPADVLELAGTVSLPAPETVRGAIFIAPDPDLITALPTWVLNKAMVVAKITSAGAAALTERRDLTRLVLTADLPAAVLRQIGDTEREAQRGATFEFDTAPLAAMAELTHLELLGVDLDDEAATALGSCPKLTTVRLRASHLTGTFLPTLAPLANQLTYLQLASEQLRGDQLMHLPRLDAASAAAFLGPHIFAGLDPLQLRKSLPNVAFLNLYGQINPPDDVEESEQSFRRLLPYRAAFAGVDVNGLQLTEKGARRAAKRLDISLDSPMSAEHDS